jgi:4-carboxymuconolactone decarboxylase
MTDGRFEHGWDTVNQINAPAAKAQWDTLSAIYPDFARWIVEAGYADILGRPALSLRDRELATVAALTVMGNAAPQLKAHITGALNNGITRDEVCEVIMQMAIYGGVPSAINALVLAKEAFDEAN